MQSYFFSFPCLCGVSNREGPVGEGPTGGNRIAEECKERVASPSTTLHLRGAARRLAGGKGGDRRPRVLLSVQVAYAEIVTSAGPRAESGLSIFASESSKHLFRTLAVVLLFVDCFDTKVRVNF